MAAEFEMPKLGLTMEFGKILSWMVEDGAPVTIGQPVLIIETDKVETEVESSGAGILSHVGEVGVTYDCGSQIGWFLEEGEEAPALAAPAAAQAGAAQVGAAQAGAPAAVAAAPVAASASVDAGGRIIASPNAKRVAALRGVDLRTVSGTGPGGRITSEDVEAAPAGGSVPLAAGAAALAVGGSAAAIAAGRAPGGGFTGANVPATLAARNLADLLGVDLSQVVPASVDPRITKEDVARHVRELLAAAAGGGSAAVAAVGAAFPLLQTPSSIIPLSGMRGTIAKRMHQSLGEMAQLTLMMDVDMGAVAADRTKRKEAGSAPGFTDYVIAAAAKALRDHPFVNSQVTDDGIALLPNVNVGMAVAIDGGLVVPVVKNTDQLELDALSTETTRLAEAAKAGKLKLDEMEGGTFSVTALGMFGVDGFTPVINPPNTAILGVGRLRDDVAWVDDGTPVKATMLTLSLTWDHRAFDGAPAAEFAQSVKAHLEGM